MPDVILEIANRLGGEVREALPWKTFEEMLEASYRELAKTQLCGPPKDFDKLWGQLLDQGGWWDGNCQPHSSAAASSQFRVPEFIAPVFDGSEQEFPFYFQPYVSGTFLDGSLAHLPWMQELPDALATVMWGSWLEVNPKTAERLQIRQGDLIRVRSPHATVEVPAIINPAIAFDVVAMPMGQGHENFTRYGSQRGANPMKILGSSEVRDVGALAWAATRVNLSKVGQNGRLAVFSGALNELGRDGELR
jgi:anaerobic selenocysteine-containing dehydrogenase